MNRRAPQVTIGVSTKMYFGYRQTMSYAFALAELADTQPALRDGSVELFFLPTYLALAEVCAVLRDSPVRVGAQDVATEDFGAFTGEVSAAVLSEIGCTLAEIGHAERRTLFGESEAITRAKTHAALRNGLIPVLCIGEHEAGDARAAVAECTRQLASAIGDAGQASVIVAYEPHWAIGAPRPAPTQHIVDVCLGLRDYIATHVELAGSRVIYGGSAGPGLVTRLGPVVDGLFLGRFAHDTNALAAIVAEAAEVAEATV